MKEINIQELQDFFFRASVNGYASGKEPETIPMFPGAKSYFWSEQIGEKFYRYVDIYFSVGNGKSFGFTIISINGKPVWYMRYSGQRYLKFVEQQEVTDTLKKVLLEAYSKKLFYGGRGMICFSDGYLDYFNLPKDKESSFERFSGQDMIHATINPYPDRVFYHDYEGGLIRK